MRLSVTVVALMLAEQFSLSSAFSVQNSMTRPQTALSSSESAEILAKARKAAGLPEEEEGPKLYTDDLLGDMQQILLTLEKRVEKGPGSVSLLEVEELQAMTGRILKDMKEKEARRLSSLTSGSAPAAVAAPVIAQETTAVAPPPAEVAEEQPDKPISYGLPQGTTNTWVIPGMDEMSPEEYQKAIQESISARQADRKASGTYGNRNSGDYMSMLSGDRGFLKEQP